MKREPMDTELETRVRTLIFGGCACRAEFNELLRRNEEARPIAARVLFEEAVLVSELRLDSAIQWAGVLEPQSFPGNAQVHAPAAAVGKRYRRLLPLAGLAAVACLGFFLWQGASRRGQEAQAVAGESAPHSRVGWMRKVEPGGFPATATPVMKDGMIELGEGRTRIDLDNGLALSLTGPARLSVNLQSTRLWQGQIAVDVPDGIETYVVETDDGRFVDLGTVFSVSAQPGKNTEMAVLSGEVRAERLSPEGDVLTRQMIGETQGAVMNGNDGGIRTVGAAELRHSAPIPPIDIGLPVPAAYRAAVDASAPLLVWDFEEVSASRVVPNRAGPDLSGRLHGEPGLGGPANGGRHLLLGGEQGGGWIEGISPWRKQDKESFTVELWARPDRIQWGHLFHLRVETSTDPVFMRAPRGPAAYLFVEFTRTEAFGVLPQQPAVRAAFRSPATEHTTNTTPDGVNSMLLSPDPYMPGCWHHIVARVDRRDFTLFVNGHAVARQTIERPDLGEQELRLRAGRLFGDRNNSRQFVGAIDELAIYGRALSDEEVSGHYRAMVGGGD